MFIYTSNRSTRNSSPTPGSQVCGELNGATCLVKGLERSFAFVALCHALQNVIAQAEADLQNLTKICMAVQEGMIPQPKLNLAAPATSEDCSSSSPERTSISPMKTCTFFNGHDRGSPEEGPDTLQ